MLSLLHSLTVFNKHKHEEYVDNIYIYIYTYILYALYIHVFIYIYIYISYISCIYMYILLGLCFIVVGRE